MIPFFRHLKKNKYILFPTENNFFVFFTFFILVLCYSFLLPNQICQNYFKYIMYSLNLVNVV